MAQHLWFLYAIGASICWGAGYVISERFLKLGLTPAFMMFLAAIITLPLYWLLAYNQGSIKSSFALILDNKFAFFLLIVDIIAIMVGNFLILHSIAAKNATLAGMVEISYPLFIFLFSWIFFQEVQLTWFTATGAALIFAGLGVILYNS